MSRLTNKGQGGPGFELYTTGVGGGTSNDASLATLVGAKFDAADGREFVLVQNGTSALVSGVLVQGPAKIGANHTNLSPASGQTAAIGATSIIVTAGGTLITVNQYQGGYLVVNAGTGIGQTLKIARNSSATSSGSCTITTEDPFSVATDSTSRFTLDLNPYGSQYGTDFRTSGVVVCPITLTGPVIGATIYPIPATTTTVLSYGLIQTRGICGVLNDATTAIGLDVMPSANTAGAVQTYVVATKCRVGTSYVAGVTTEVRPIVLQL